MQVAISSPMWLSSVINTPKTNLKIQNSLQRHPFGGKIVWINNKANSTYFRPKIWNLGFQRKDACASTFWVGHPEPSGQHSLGGKMSVLVGDAHGLCMWSPNIFIVALTNANRAELSIFDFYRSTIWFSPTPVVASAAMSRPCIMMWTHKY